MHTTYSNDTERPIASSRTENDPWQRSTGIPLRLPVIKKKKKERRNVSIYVIIIIIIVIIFLGPASALRLV